VDRRELAKLGFDVLLMDYRGYGVATATRMKDRSTPMAMRIRLSVSNAA